MNNLQTFFEEYIAFCQYQKRLDRKTLNAYKTDLKQFSQQLHSISIEAVTPDMLENYISHLHQSYKPKTVKRKIASLKAFFHYLEYKEIIDRNPFNKIHVKFREPVILPKTIPLRTVETFLPQYITNVIVLKLLINEEMQYAISQLLNCYSPQVYEYQNYVL